MQGEGISFVGFRESSGGGYVCGLAGPKRGSQRGSVEAYTGGRFYMNSLGNVWLRGPFLSLLIPFDSLLLLLPHSSIPPPLSMFTHTHTFSFFSGLRL